MFDVDHDHDREVREKEHPNGEAQAVGLNPGKQAKGQHTA
jgi:hypothetical protein